MLEVSAVAVIVAGLLSAGWSVALAARGAAVGDRTLVLLVVTEALLAVQLAAAALTAARGDTDSPLTLLAYAVGSLILLPIGTLWSLAERSRPSVLVITVAALAVTVMSARMLQVAGG